MRGRRTPLVEAILVGSFRPDRMGGRLLTEMLPQTCPVADAPPEAEKVWRDLCTSQAAFVDAGAPRPWAFGKLVREFHKALTPEPETEPDRGPRTIDDSRDRSLALSALWLGPTSDHPDEVLVEHWNTWASTASEWGDHPDTYAHLRFLEGLSAKAAEAKLAKIRAERHEKWLLERIDECDVRDWDPLFRGTPLAERRRLLRKAGRPDLIDPAGCERFGITEAR